MTNEEWLKQSGKNGAYTFVNPYGSDQAAWRNSNLTNKNSIGQTYAQGTIHDNGKGFAVYDGAQNILGWGYGDGTLESASADGDTRALEAARAQFLASGGVLDGVSGKEAYGAAERAGAVNLASSLGSYKMSADGKVYSGRGDINGIYDAQQRAAVAALERAYQQSVAGYDKAKEGISADYYEMARRAQAQADRERQNTNESMAASGLNTGAVGQAALAQSNVLQGNLTAINTAEAQALNDVDTALAQLKADYQVAVAEAIANNETERAKALYQQYLNEQQTALQREQTLYQRQQAALQQQQSQQSAAQKLAQSQVDALIKAGITPSDELLAASGYGSEYAGGLSAYYAAQAAAKASKSGGTSGTPTVPESEYDDTHAAWAQAVNNYTGGDDNLAYQYIVANWRNAGYNSQDEAFNAYEVGNRTLQAAEAPRAYTPSAAANALANQLRTVGPTDNFWQSVDRVRASGRLSDRDVDYLLKLMGY